MAAKKTTKDDTDSEFKNPNDILTTVLKNDKNQLNSALAENINYIISTGSLRLDSAMDGGLGPGVHRVGGISEGGKTSFCLQVMRNFLNTVEGGRGIFIKAEGRLGDNMKRRAGVEFLETPDEILNWRSKKGNKPGNCFVYNGNVYDDIIKLISHLIDNRDETKYCIVIDSMDALILQEDKDKYEKNMNTTSEKKQESERVAGAPKITKMFLKQMGLKLCAYGHLTFFISQVSANIETQYQSLDSKRQSNLMGTGGNAVVHWSNYTLEFMPRYNKDIITLKGGEDSKPDPDTNPILGHMVSVSFKKTPNEKSGYVYRYPVKYGAKPGKSVWLAREVFDMLLGWELIKKRGSWFNWSEFGLEKLKEIGYEPEAEKIQGRENMLAVVENDEKLCNYWYEYFSEVIKESQDQLESEEKDASDEGEEETKNEIL